jgi:hypothetical protein
MFLDFDGLSTAPHLIAKRLTKTVQIKETKKAIIPHSISV